MRGEYCEVADFRDIDDDQVEMSDISRMEWQANYFASSILMGGFKVHAQHDQ
jgi:Zn-dependent peptidase ImmA (M78 family)